jgi:hypothetical protein
MKLRTALLCLAAFSIFVCAVQGVEHLMRARETKAILSIMRPTDREIEHVQGILRADYRAAEGATVVIFAQGTIIFLLIRRDPGYLIA